MLDLPDFFLSQTLIVFSDFQISHIQQKSLAFNTIRKYYDKPKESFIWQVRKIFWKTNISDFLIRTHTCAYQWVRKFIFSENFNYDFNFNHFKAF